MTDVSAPQEIKFTPPKISPVVLFWPADLVAHDAYAPLYCRVLARRYLRSVGRARNIAKQQYYAACFGASLRQIRQIAIEANVEGREL